MEPIPIQAFMGQLAIQHRETLGGELRIQG
jgi:hypothetical protein